MNAPVAIGEADFAAVIDEHPGVVASPDRITGWAEIAKPGAEFVYATRCYLPIGSRGAEAARDLAERGLVYLKQRRVPNSREINYVAERSKAPWRQIHDRPKAAPSRPRAASGDAAAVDAVLPILQRAARFNRPCPTDVQIADRAGITVDAVQPALDALKANGVIRVSKVKAPTLRMITIVATSHKTGMVG
jgi:hypothetical protein